MAVTRRRPGVAALAVLVGAATSLSCESKAKTEQATTAAATAIPPAPSFSATSTSTPVTVDTTAGAVADPFAHDAAVLGDATETFGPDAPSLEDSGLPKLAVEVQSVTVTGGALSRETVMRVAQPAHPLVARCYAAATKGEPGLTVTIGVDLDVDASGAVANASAGSGTILPSGSGFVPCVIGVFKGLVFPAPGATTHVSYVLQCSPAKS